MAMTSLDLNRIDKKEQTTMSTDFMIQQIYIEQLEGRRREEMWRNEQFRIARMTRPSFRTLIARRIGTMLISVGESLHQEPVARPEARLERFNATRTA